MDQVASRLMLPQLPVRFYEYMKIKGRVLAAPVDPKQVGQFLTHYYCKEVTYRVYSFVTTSQGYPDILSCDLNKHVSCLSEHVMIESHGIL